MSITITTTIAAQRAAKIRNSAPTIATVIGWCKDYGIGSKVGGRWMVYPDKLDQFLHGKLNEENQNKE